MKPTINKSQVMKRAWNIYRGHNLYSHSFSASLRRAWWVEKDTIRYEAEKVELAVERARLDAVREMNRNCPPIDYALYCPEAVTQDYWNARPRHLCRRLINQFITYNDG